MNIADAEVLARMDRTVAIEFDVNAGAYRVLAHSGEESAPESVMLEIAAPMTVDSETSWRVVGGVVTWVAGEWQIESIRPTEIEQPPSGATSVAEFTDEDRAAVFDSLGWETFAEKR